MDAVDVIVIGAGPNGLAAAITVARAGLSVTVLEAAPTVGGGTRTAELTRPGFHHDVCAAVHPLAAGSPFFRDLPLSAHGLELVQPDVPLVHPLDGCSGGVLDRSLTATAYGLGVDGESWRGLLGPVVQRWERIGDHLLGPVVRPLRHPMALAGFGLRGVRSARHLASRFDTDEARGLLAGLSAHGFLPLTAPLTGSFAMLLGALAHLYGWPFVRGGSQKLADALSSHLLALGGTIVTGHRVSSLDELPPARAILADITPHQLVALAGDRLSTSARRSLGRFQVGPGVCKVDYALSDPVPWAAEAGRRAGTLHLGGRFEEIASAEDDVAKGRHPERPFVLVAQPSSFDDTRAPLGRHTLWAYCHVPNGSTVDMCEPVTAQIERFAPGFRDTILDRYVRTAAAHEDYNPSYVGGDISAGSHAGMQLIFRPRPSVNPYRTPIDGVFLCSGSTPPGGGVHGMCGYHAARAALRQLRRGAA